MNPDHQPRRSIEIRRYHPGEEQALQEIYSESTRRLNSKHYTPAQIERWVAKHADLAEWTERVKTRNPFVAVSNGRPVAFAELESNGHIDFFYCHPDAVGQGAGRLLMQAITTEASRLGLTELYSEVSVTAESFFTKNGFLIREVLTPIICGALAKQYIMWKGLV